MVCNDSVAPLTSGFEADRSCARGKPRSEMKTCLNARETGASTEGQGMPGVSLQTIAGQQNNETSGRRTGRSCTSADQFALERRHRRMMRRCNMFACVVARRSGIHRDRSDGQSESMSQAHSPTAPWRRGRRAIDFGALAPLQPINIVAKDVTGHGAMRPMMTAHGIVWTLLNSSVTM